MNPDEQNISANLLKVIGEENVTVGITGSPSSTLEITIDIKEETKSDRILGQMVYVVLEEDAMKILVIGQVIEIETRNRWHEDQAFKGVIKRHGQLPHLSGVADNRIAKISVQACYNLGRAEPSSHILGTSPSTGENVKKMNNDVMSALMRGNEKHLTYMGKVFGTDVDLPFWFKHFDKNDESNDELGAREAYHIGVFGKTGSGKTTTAAYILAGYAKNKNNMNILVIDPQGQFYNDNELLPQGKKLEDVIKSIGMKYYKLKVMDDLYLPNDAHDLFATLLQKSGFIRASFNILSDREANAADAIGIYLQNSFNNSKGSQANLATLWNDDKSFTLMKNTLKKFTQVDEPEGNSSKKKDVKYNKYIDMIYSQSARKDQLIEKIESVISNDDHLKEIYDKYWKPVALLFTEKKPNGSNKTKIDYVIDLIATEGKKGNFAVLDMSEKSGGFINENIQALFVKIIENRVKERGESFYVSGKKANCLIVMDEAHRFISRESEDPQILELTSEIIDSVRTTRKFGIGYMFITQTLESLDKEILQQIRIFAFGYGLTAGPEFRRITDIVNNESALKLYKSFIDPSSNGKFPFMFFGPVSPLSFTGSPLFIEVYSDVGKFR